MKIEDEIQINQYGQDLIEIELLVNRFEKLGLAEKRLFLEHVIYYFILQSRIVDADIPEAIAISKLKLTYTPCIMLKKGVAVHNLELMVKLPENELNKVFILLLSLFKIGYKRRFHLENNHPSKWWYWDLSDEKNIVSIIDGDTSSSA